MSFKRFIDESKWFADHSPAYSGVSLWRLSSIRAYLRYMWLSRPEWL